VGLWKNGGQALLADKIIRHGAGSVNKVGLKVV